MTSIVNLFSNFDDLNKTKSVVDTATTYETTEINAKILSTSLNQGKKFKKYQKKIIKNLEKDIEKVNSKEGFQINQNQLNLSNNGLTSKTNTLIEDNDFSSQEKIIADLKNQYENTLSSYKTLSTQIATTTSNYFNRISPNNQYLNKTVRFTTGQLAYVTNQGVLKYIPSLDILNSINAPKSFVEINLPWNNSWSNQGATIPTTPPLVSGTPVKLNQSLGNEGANVFVNKLINNPTSSYKGCYNDNKTKPLMTFIGGSPSSNNSGGTYTYDMCQQAAIDSGYQYFALQDVNSSTSKGYCSISNSKSSSTSLGESFSKYKLWSSDTSGQTGNTATLTNAGALSLINSSGQSIFTTPNTPSQTSNSNYLLILQDDGNMCVYRGTSPNNKQELIWSSNTTAQFQKANPAYSAVKGKFGKNWITNGATLASGDFVGSNSGNIALILQPDGNLVLYTFDIICKKMSDGNMGGGIEANALYSIPIVPSNLLKLAYVDQNSELYSYLSNNTKYLNTYTTLKGSDISGNNIAGATYGNSTSSSCQTSCNNNSECTGFTFSNSNNTCYLKNFSTYPNNQKQINPNVDLYIRNKQPITTPKGISNNVNNIDTVTYQNYVKGNNTVQQYGLSNETGAQKQELSKLQTLLDELSDKLKFLTGKFSEGSHNVENQLQLNNKGIQDYSKGIVSANNKATNFGSNVENILNDSDIVVLQKNYNYLFWSILAVGTVLISMNTIKNK